MLRKNTVARVKVFGKKRHKWEPEILKMIDPDQIRPRFGGTMEDTEPEEIHDLNIDLNNLKIKDWRTLNEFLWNIIV